MISVAHSVTSAARLVSIYCKAFAIAMLTLLTALPAFAQQSPQTYSLLWRISGKGMAQPSYLFGTMHVKDKRAFQFSDSVMLAIQNCKAFALEVHPDSIVKEMFSSVSERDSTSKLSKLLSKEEYDELARRFKEKNGFPMGDLSAGQVESYMQQTKDKPDDKKTFVDAYLFGVARGMGKELLAVESSSSQYDDYYGSTAKIKERLLELLETDDDLDESTEQLVDVYSTGNLQAILNYLDENQMDDSVLIGRNQVMLKNMMAYMQRTSLFTAVGTAHLPAETGLISLLRKAGYTVTLVPATFTGIADKFNTDYTKLKWYTYSSPESGYSLDFPFAPMRESVNSYLSTIVFADIANDAYMGVYAIFTGQKNQAGNLNKYIAALVKAGKTSTRKQILVNGLPATDLTVINPNGGGLRYRVIAKDNFLYCLYAGGNTSIVDKQYADRFFNSFKYSPPSPPKPANWITFHNDTAAFTVSFPMQPIRVNKTVPVPNKPEFGALKLNMFVTTDSVNMINYLVRYNDYPSGTYLAEPAQIFTAVTDEIKSNGAEIKSSRPVYNNGIEGREIDFLLKTYRCRAQLYARGNRFYMVLVQNLSGKTIPDLGAAYFKTFKMTPYMSSTPTLATHSSGVFQVAHYPDPKIIPDTTENFRAFTSTIENTFSTDPTTGGLYGVEYGKISPYYRAANVDSVYTQIEDYLVRYSDSLLTSRYYEQGGMRIKELVLLNKSTKVKTYYSLLIDKDRVFYFTTHAGDEEVSSRGNAVLKSFKIIKPETGFDLTSSKAKLILADLTSTDSTTRKAALGAFSYYTFDKTELPLLYTALQKTYGDTEADNTVRTAMIKALSTAKDESAIPELVKFATAKETPKDLKISAIAAVPGINPKKGYDIYLDLLTKSADVDGDSKYLLFNPLTDSLEYTAANLNRILPLLKNKGNRRGITNVLTSFTTAKNKAEYLPLLQKHFDEITAYALEDANDYIAIKDDTTNADRWKTPVYNYFVLMQHVTGKNITDAFTTKIINSDSYQGYKSEAATTRLYNNLPVGAAVLNKLLDSLPLRYGTLKALNSTGSLSKAPAQYRTIAALAKAKLFHWLYDEDEENVQTATTLGNIQSKGKTYMVLKYTTEYNTESQKIAIYGPYVPAATPKLNFDSNYDVYTTYDEVKTDWRTQAMKMVPLLLKQKADAAAVR